jgi:hypothetical protein
MTLPCVNATPMHPVAGQVPTQQLPAMPPRHTHRPTYPLSLWRQLQPLPRVTFRVGMPLLALVLFAYLYCTCTKYLLKCICMVPPKGAPSNVHANATPQSHAHRHFLPYKQLPTAQPVPVHHGPGPPTLRNHAFGH